MAYRKFICLIVSVAVIVSIAFFVVHRTLITRLSPFTNSSPSSSIPAAASPTSAIIVSSAIATTAASSAVASTSGLSWPISEALTRTTKKTFGLYVTPKNSPVSPERFTGYHTGVDFETTPQEQDADVSIYAICAGPLILKKAATGYGGVAVQSCEINKEPVTVIYGHLRLSSIGASSGSLLSAGQAIGVLGKGYSSETDGERKHLHLGIHKGAAVSLLGYVPDKSQLNQWFDFLSLMK